MITLTQLSCTYGAPMGRRDEGNLNNATSFALEWMPFVDDCYDAGGAYWGGGDPLYCIVGYADGEEVARHYVRAKDRDDASDIVAESLDSEQCFPVPETGSIVKQTIEFLEEYKAGLSIEEEDMVEATNDEIEALEGWLENGRLA